MNFKILNYNEFFENKVTLVGMDELDLETLDLRLLEYQEHKNSVISLINTTPRLLEKIRSKFGENFSAVHIIRDPRDILISGYFHHLDGHPVDNSYFYWGELADLRRRLKELDKETGILVELNSITKRVLSNINLVPRKENILTIRLEDFTRTPQQMTKEISGFFNTQIQDAEIDLARIQKQSSNARKNPQDWQEHFTPLIKSVFKEQYGKLLINLGYEKNLDW